MRTVVGAPDGRPGSVLFVAGGALLFPVGGYHKDEIRQLARNAGIRTADKPDSQEICFIPDNDYGRFLNDYRGEQETAGEFVDTAGNVVGQHPGYQHFTIGQRRGLGVTFGEPRFVVRIEPDTRRVVPAARARNRVGSLRATALPVSESLAMPRPRKAMQPTRCGTCGAICLPNFATQCRTPRSRSSCPSTTTSSRNSTAGSPSSHHEVGNPSWIAVHFYRFRRLVSWLNRPGPCNHRLDKPPPGS